MKGHLLMSSKELKRKTVLEHVAAGRATQVEAARLLDVSYRQVTRLRRRYEEQGEAGLVHMSRGRPSNRRFPPEFLEEALALYRRDYAGFGPTLACEKLALKGYTMAAETLRRHLLRAGLWSLVRTRPEHRSWRPRKEHFGELVQMDGSHHAWFGPEHSTCCLMVMVDDARGLALAWLAEQETTQAAMRLLGIWLETFGIPQALYTDRKNVYLTDREPTLEEQLAGQEPRTAFGLACAKLGITIIPAHSPQAKGRVERKNGVFQDRFLKELRLESITTIEAGNELLYQGFLDSLNRKFARPAAREVDFHTPLPPGLDLTAVFCFEQTRTIQNDWTIQHENRRYQIGPSNRPLPRPKDKVLVRTHLDGTLNVLYRDKPLVYTLLPPAGLTPPVPNPRESGDRPGRAPRAKTGAAPPPKAPKPYTPAADHPWRKKGTTKRPGKPSIGRAEYRSVDGAAP